MWILYRADEEKIKELYVVALNEQELVMVRASGNIEQLAARAMREHHRGGEFRVDSFF